MKNVISANKVFKLLLFIIFLLTCAHITVQVLRFTTGHDVMFGLIPMFDMNRESNIPTLYSGQALFLASLLLYFITRVCKEKKMPYAKHWYGLAFVFIFLGVDEMASIHELLTKPLREAFNTSGVLYYAWVIPYALIICLLAVIYIRFLINLPRHICIGFVISGIIFIFGAVGLELIGGKLFMISGDQSILYTLTATFEEMLEMSGIALFVKYILQYLSEITEDVDMGVNFVNN